MPRNFYLILGIPSDATQGDIKSAYRKLVKEHHPDRSAGGSSPFLAIQEAYSVLSDPDQRRSYDENASGQIRVTSKTSPPPPQRRPHYSEVEPLIPQRRNVEPINASLAGSFHSFRPSYDGLFDRILSNFTAPGGRSRQDRIENLNVVITLTQAQARQGGHVRLLVPLHLNCPSCHGKGGVGVYECWRGRGRGVMKDEQPVTIQYPAGIPDNYTEQLSLDRFGIFNFYLTVHFRISKVA